MTKEYNILLLFDNIMKSFELPNWHCLVLYKVKIYHIAVKSVNTDKSKSLSLVIDIIDYFQRLLWVLSWVDLMVGQVFIVAWSRDDCNIQSLFYFLFYKAPYLYDCLWSLLPLIVSRQITSYDHSINTSHFLTYEVKPTFEQLHWRITFRITKLLSLCGISFGKSVLSMAANGKITNYRTIDCVIQVQMYICQMKQFCISFVYFNLLTFIRDFIDVFERVNYIIIDNAIHFCLQVQPCIKSFRAKGFAESTCFQNATITHSDCQRSQLF